MKVRVYRDETDWLDFEYTEDMEPEVIEQGNYFTVFYLSGYEQEDETDYTECDYPTSNYYYECI